MWQLAYSYSIAKDMLVTLMHLTSVVACKVNISSRVCGHHVAATPQCSGNATRCCVDFGRQDSRFRGGAARTSLIVSVGSLALSLVYVQLASGSITFADADFDNGEWLTASFSDKPFNFGAAQQATGGNPDAYREVTHMLSTSLLTDATVVHTWSQATFTPSVQGAINSIDFAIDYFSTPAGEHGFAVALLQDGKYYRKMGLDETVVGSAWTHFSVDDRLAENFVEILPDASLTTTSHPDFSSGGSSIVFGFVTANMNSVGDATAGYDNFSVTLDVTPIAEPIFPGDYNDDGVVDAADYTVWRDSEGMPAGTLVNDVDGGAIGHAQYNTWVANFGNTDLPAIAIPEPSSCALLFVSALLARGRRRLTRS